jgi:drug/metabolite transporter (DMT)-like permease
VTPADRTVLIAVTGAAVIGTSAVLMRLAEVSPGTASLFRCAYAVPPLALLALLERRRLGPRLRHSHRLASGSGIFLGLNFLLLNTAILLVGAGIATVLGNLQVIIVAGMGWLLFSERPGRRVLVALPVALGGLVLISGALESDAYGADPAAGTVMSSGTSIAYAATC